MKLKMADQLRSLSKSWQRSVWYVLSIETFQALISDRPWTLLKGMSSDSTKPPSNLSLDRFAVALKHHIRGEVGIYYEDLYDLVRPLHEVCYLLLRLIISQPRLARPYS